MGRLIAIGDVHGCKAALESVLEQIRPEEGDEFVFLGDLIDRGPDSKGVCDVAIALALKHHTTFIMGNHEEMAMMASQGRSDLKSWLRHGGDEALRSWGIEPVSATPQDVLTKIPGEHLRIFGNMSNIYADLDGDNVFVHASYNSCAGLHEQSVTDLRWSKLDPNVGPMYSRTGRRMTVWCGHTVQPHVKDLGHVVCIDLGCGARPNGRLAAVDVRSRKYWYAYSDGRVASR